MADWSKISSRGIVKDRRGMAAVGGGIGTIGILAVLVFNVLTGSNINPAVVDQAVSQLQQLQGQAEPSSRQPEEFRGQDDYEVFASIVLGSTNELWQQFLARNNVSYQEPALVLFRDATTSGCGGANSQIGPHYCPTDQTIYLDETFFDELEQRFGAEGGDVAEAYVIAHEVGHHVQQQLGITHQLQAAQRADPSRANELSIAIELQADCLAGVWANSISHLGVFEPGEMQEAIDAAAAVGDDRIQEKIQGQVNPETWTHGSSEQRVAWFTKGLETGQPAQCGI